MFKNRFQLFVGLVFATGFTTVASAAEPAPADGDLGGRIVLIGAQMTAAPKESAIWTISPTGDDAHKLLGFDQGTIDAGRLSPDGSRLAFTYSSRTKSARELWLTDLEGIAEKVSDDAGLVTAWSPDGAQIAFYRIASRTCENFVFDVKSKRETKLPLAFNYIAEDWNATSKSRTLVDFNATESFEVGDASYALRQIDLLKPDGKIVPLNEDPAQDNLWARFSPSGDRVARYRLHFVDGQAKHGAVICNTDGSHEREVCSFADIRDAEHLERFSARGCPAWSPDEKWIAWLIATAKSSRDDEVWELVLIPVAGGECRRIPLGEKGFVRATAIEWR